MHPSSHPRQIYHGFIYNFSAFICLYYCPSWLMDGYPYVSRLRSILILLVSINMMALAWKLACRLFYRSIQINVQQDTKMNRFSTHRDKVTPNDPLLSDSFSPHRTPIRPFVSTHPSSAGSSPAPAGSSAPAPAAPATTTTMTPIVGSPFGSGMRWTPFSPLSSSNPSPSYMRPSLGSPPYSSPGLDRSQIATVTAASPPPSVYRVGRTSYNGSPSGANGNAPLLLVSPSKNAMGSASSSSSSTALTFYNPFGASVVLTPPATLAFLSTPTLTMVPERNHSKLKAWFKSTLLLPLLSELVSLDGWLDAQGWSQYGCRRFPFLRAIRSQSGGQDYQMIQGREEATERLRLTLTNASNASTSFWLKRLLLEKFLSAASVSVSISAASPNALSPMDAVLEEEKKRNLICERLLTWSTSPISIQKIWTEHSNSNELHPSMTCFQESESLSIVLDDESLLIHLFSVFMDARMPESDSAHLLQSGAFSRHVLLYEPIVNSFSSSIGNNSHRFTSPFLKSPRFSSSPTLLNQQKVLSKSASTCSVSGTTSAATMKATEPLRFDLFPIRLVSAKSGYYVLCDHRHVALVPNSSLLPSAESCLLESLLYALYYLRQEWSGYLGLSHLGNRQFDLLQIVQANPIGSESTLTK